MVHYKHLWEDLRLHGKTSDLQDLKPEKEFTKNFKPEPTLEDFLSNHMYQENKKLNPGQNMNTFDEKC